MRWRGPRRRPWEGSRCRGAGSGCGSDTGPRCGGRHGSGMWRLQLPRGPRRQQRRGSGGTACSLEMRRRGLSRRQRGLRRALAPGRRPPGSYNFGDISSKYRCDQNEMLPLIVNTPGWVKGAGFDMLIEMLRYYLPRNSCSDMHHSEEQESP